MPRATLCQRTSLALLLSLSCLSLSSARHYLDTAVVSLTKETESQDGDPKSEPLFSREEILRCFRDEVVLNMTVSTNLRLSFSIPAQTGEYYIHDESGGFQCTMLASLPSRDFRQFRLQVELLHQTCTLNNSVTMAELGYTLRWNGCETLRDPLHNFFGYREVSVTIRVGGDMSKRYSFSTVFRAVRSDEAQLETRLLTSTSGMYSLSLSLSLSLTLSVSRSVCVSLSLALSRSLCVSLTHSLALCVCAYSSVAQSSLLGQGRNERTITQFVCFVYDNDRGIESSSQT